MGMLRRVAPLLAAALLVLVLAACSRGPDSAASAAPARLAVCADLFPLHEWAARVAGPDADVTLLAGGGADPHQFAPSLQDLAQIGRSRVLIVVGLGLEPWSRRAVDSADGRTELWEVGTWVSRRRMEHAEPVGEEKEGPAAHAGHEHGESGEDPHIWLDPERAARIVRRMGDEFARLDPAHADGYRARATEYERELEALGKELIAAGAALRGRALVVFHNAYGYLFDRLGLRTAGVIQISPGLAPSPRDVVESVRRMREIGQKNVFVEAEYESAARPVAEALGGRVVQLDHLTLREVPWGRTYAERLRHDVKVLAENLP
jgi:zinc transport system substrate-binding protein